MMHFYNKYSPRVPARVLEILNCLESGTFEEISTWLQDINTSLRSNEFSMFRKPYSAWRILTVILQRKHHISLKSPIRTQLLKFLDLVNPNWAAFPFILSIRDLDYFFIDSLNSDDRLVSELTLDYILNNAYKFGEAPHHISDLSCIKVSGHELIEDSWKNDELPDEIYWSWRASLDEFLKKAEGGEYVKVR